jgi:hypothetical protein
MNADIALIGKLSPSRNRPNSVAARLGIHLYVSSSDPLARTSGIPSISMDKERINATIDIVAATKVEQFLREISIPKEIRAGINNASNKFGIIIN